MIRTRACLLFAAALLLYGCSDNTSVSNRVFEDDTSTSSGADASSGADMSSSSGSDVIMTSGVDAMMTSSSSGIDASSSGPDVTSSGIDASSSGIDASSSGVDTSSGMDTVALGAIGDACADGAECASGICAALSDGSGMTCSECATAADCSGADDTCEHDTNVGAMLCVGPAGQRALGETCADGSDCASGYCFGRFAQDGLCSQCEENTDCGASDCSYDQFGGDPYARCVGNIDLGGACTADDECSSGVCDDNDVCAECITDADCGQGGVCQPDMGDGYATCLDGYGAPCNQSSPETCGSGLCYPPPFGNTGTCTECVDDSDCGANGTCDPPSFQNGRLYGQCLGPADLGEMCTDGAECNSTFCNGGACSECEEDFDCGEGGLCQDDTATAGYFTCIGGLGESCEMDADCTSGHCYSAMFGDVCSECKNDNDCGNNQSCEAPSFDTGATYATCVGIIANGDGCVDDAECQSSICNNSVCSDCRSDADCTDPAGGPNGTCDDETGGSIGYHICRFELGQVCDGPDNCNSGQCFDTGFGNVCSECDDGADCSGGDACEMSFNMFPPYAVCQ